MTDIQKQVNDNYAAFQKLLQEFLVSHPGKFALMHDGKLVNFFDTAQDAFTAGSELFVDGLFSIQEVTGKPVDLGYYSYAMP